MVSLDNVLTVPVNALGRTVGHLSAVQEAELARAVVLAFDGSSYLRWGLGIRGRRSLLR